MFFFSKAVCQKIRLQRRWGVLILFDIICLIPGCSECFDRNKATSVQLPAPEVVRKNGSKEARKQESQEEKEEAKKGKLEGKKGGKEAKAKEEACK